MPDPCGRVPASDLVAGQWPAAAVLPPRLVNVACCVLRMTDQGRPPWPASCLHLYIALSGASSRHGRGMMPEPHDPQHVGQATLLLSRWREGDAEARDRLFPLVYQELRNTAERLLRREQTGHTLQPT
ncbi:MAG: ECF-type sigma factor, partial [Gemmatimonadales bacterium]